MKISELIEVLKQYPDDNYFNILIGDTYYNYSITSIPEDLNCIATVDVDLNPDKNAIEGVNYGTYEEVE